MFSVFFTPKKGAISGFQERYELVRFFTIWSCVARYIFAFLIERSDVAVDLFFPGSFFFLFVL